MQVGPPPRVLPELEPLEWWALCSVVTNQTYEISLQALPLLVRQVQLQQRQGSRSVEVAFTVSLCSNA
jgi:hypothetical protein